MGIKKIKVVNFKSFENIEVELGKFNVLIGANASGKSNFVQIFKFLKDIADSGLENAVSVQGGVKYLRNIKIGASKDLSIRVVSDDKFALAIPTKDGLIGVKNYETTYEFALSFYKRRAGFKIKRDRLNQKFKFVVLEKQVKGFKEKEVIGEGEVLISRSNGKVKIDLTKPQDVPIKEDDLFPPILKEIDIPSNVLFLETPIFSFFFLLPIKQIFSYISIYDFDPKLPKKATSITVKAELEEDGSNLSLVLKNILAHKEKRRKLLNLMKDLLPFVEDLYVEKFADESPFFKLKERYFEKEYLPASLISDGTIDITALITALYFGKKPLIIIEEPERN
ncbi:MAG: ATPase, partial [Candidatus Hydrothermota bacterium]